MEWLSNASHQQNKRKEHAVKEHILFAKPSVVLVSILEKYETCLNPEVISSCSRPYVVLHHLTGRRRYCLMLYK